VDLRAYGTHLSAEGPFERDRHCFHKRDLKTAATACGSYFSPDESGADNNDAVRTGIEFGAQSKGIGHGADNVYSAHPGGVGESPGRSASCDDECVIGNGLKSAVTMLHGDNLRGCVQRRSPGPESKVEAEFLPG